MLKNIIPSAIYALLALIIMLPLLGQGYYLALDMQWGPVSFSESRFCDFYGYCTNPYGAYLPLRMVFAALSSIISIDIIEKVLLFSVLFLCGHCMHSSLPEKLGNARYFGGLLYTLNPFVFVRFLAGHWTFLLSYALWPVAIKMFLDFIKKPDRKNLAKTALVTMLAAVSSHGIAMLMISYFVIFLFHIFKSPSLKVLAKQTAVLAVLVLAMNLFWIAPTLMMFGEKYAPASAEAYLTDFSPEGEGLSPPEALLTMHGFWRTGFYYTKDVFELWYLPYILIVALCIAGLYALFRKNPLYAASMLTIFVLAFLLAMGGRSPVSWVFTFLGEKLPLYFFFRDSQKFVGLLALVYSILGVYGIHFILQRFKGYLRIALLLALLIIPVAYNYGFFGFLGQIGATTYPQEWAVAEEIIAADDMRGYIWVVPSHLYAHYYWVNGSQKTLATPASHFFSRPVIGRQNLETANVYSDWADPQGTYMAYLYIKRQQVNDTAELLLPLNARYIILFKHFPESPHALYLFHREGGVDNMELVFDGPSMYLFRNNLMTGPFIASKENGTGLFTELINLSGKGLYSTNVSYTMITPARFYIDDCPYPYLVFAPPYNKFLEFNGQPPSSWHSISNVFEYSGPGILQNTLFHYVLAFFLLSWALALALVLSPSAVESASMAGLFAVIYILALNGMLMPSSIGALLLVSAVAVGVILRLRKS